MHDFPTEFMEKEADDFASEFLMPSENIRDHFRSRLRVIKA